MTLTTSRRSDRLLPPHLFLVLGAFAAVALAITPAQAETASQCARYGADYVAVAGSNGCVRLGGHVRVDMPRHQQQVAPPMGYAELSHGGVQHAAASRSALPPMAPFGLHDLFPR